MSKRAYRGDSVAKSEGTRINGNGSGNSRKVISRSELDEIAVEDGLHFLSELGLGNSLYANKDKTLKRVYDRYGNVVNTYIPKGCLQSTVEFHHPVEVSGSSLTTPAVRQYKGRNGFMKMVLR